MRRKILVAIIAVVVSCGWLIASRPDTFVVKRTQIMAAPPAVVFAQINDLRAWSSWSPWEKLDPGIQRTYGDHSAGIGAAYAWSGNDKVGQGTMMITDVRVPEYVGLDLVFIKPYAATNRATFDVVPILRQQVERIGLGETVIGTTVTWTMTGSNSFLNKAVGLFASVDSLVGPDFESGLSRLKAVSEKAALQANVSPLRP